MSDYNDNLGSSLYQDVGPTGATGVLASNNAQFTVHLQALGIIH